MVAGCGMKCLKFLIFFFNFLFLIVGAGLIAAGVFVRVAYGAQPIAADLVNAVTIPIFVVGSLIMVPAFFGCCGACRENRCMLVTYAVIMGILTLLEVIIGIIGFVYLAKLRTMLETYSQTLLDRHGEGDSFAALTVAVIQGTFSCCGIYGPNDWLNRPQNNTNVPQSCCNTSPCQTDQILPVKKFDDTGISPQGCLQLVEDQLRPVILYICGTMLGTAFVEILGIVLAVCLIKAARNRD